MDDYIYEEQKWISFSKEKKSFSKIVVSAAGEKKNPVQEIRCSKCERDKDKKASTGKKYQNFLFVFWRPGQKFELNSLENRL